MKRRRLGILVCFFAVLVLFVVSNTFSRISATDIQETPVQEAQEIAEENSSSNAELIKEETTVISETENSLANSDETVLLKNQVQIGTRALGVVEVSSFTQLKDTIELANLTNDTVTIKLMNSFDIEEGIKISSNVEIVSDNSQTLTRKASLTNSEFFHVLSNGQLKLSTGVILNGDRISIVSTNASAIDVEGVLVIDGAIITGFVATRNSPIVVRDGGNVSLETGSITANEMDGGTLLANGGGALQVYDGGAFTMNGGSVDNNVANVWGAGINVLNGGSFYLNDGEIHHNRQLHNDATGGGIYVEEGGNFTMNNGKIHHNIAGGGAGITIGHPNDQGIDVSQININAGEIYDNQAVSDYGYGGGIFIASPHPVINMTDLYVADNSAVYGGGIYNCPTSDTKNYITSGSIFVNNTASSGGNFFYSAVPAVGYENRDFYISDRVLGGGLQNLYKDFSPRYLSGDQPLESSTYQYVNSQLLLHNEIMDSSTIELAKAEAKILIYNNSAGIAGGGITNNAFLTIGEKNAEKTLKIKKEWKVETNQIPEAIEVQLIRLDENNNEVDLEILTLTKGSDWSATLNDLPGNYSYKVKEVNADQYDVAYNEMVNGREITITITNKAKTSGSNGIVMKPSIPAKSEVATPSINTGSNDLRNGYVLLLLFSCFAMTKVLMKRSIK